MLLWICARVIMLFLLGMLTEVQWVEVIQEPQTVNLLDICSRHSVRTLGSGWNYGAANPSPEYSNSISELPAEDSAAYNRNVRG